jgi:NADPH:quinone reductase-like Zn-dependent oxidoreductase
MMSVIQGQGLYQSLKLPLPTTPSTTPIPLLIYGASTATGILGLQFAKLSGCVVAATSSPHNFEYLRSLGADAVFDYNSPTCAADIKAWGESLAGGLHHAWDCIATAQTAALCAAALDTDKEGHYRSLLRVPDEAVKGTNAALTNGVTLAYTAIGEDIEKGVRIPARPEDLEWGAMFWKLAAGLLDQGKVKPANIDLNRGSDGLAGVLTGLEELKAGKVSGLKLVYTLG